MCKVLVCEACLSPTSDELLVTAVATAALAFAAVLKRSAFSCTRLVDRVKTVTGLFSAFLLCCWMNCLLASSARLQS